MRGSDIGHIREIMEKKNPKVIPGFTLSYTDSSVHARTARYILRVDCTVTNASPFAFAFPALPAWLEYPESSLYIA